MEYENIYMKVPPGPDPPRSINAIVEIPKGRRSKFEIDKKYGLIRLDRYLYSSAMYPGDYGIVPQTLAEDGDPLDVLVMVNEPTFAGCLIEARPIGLFKMVDKGVNDFKILAVPNTDPIFAEIRDLWRVPPHFLREVEHFFATYKQLEGGDVYTQGWQDADMAREEIMASIHRYLVSKPEEPLPEEQANESDAGSDGDTDPTSEDDQGGDKRSISFLNDLD